LDFAPITLLFGGNSSGKSTIIHAIYYALEVLEHRNLDPGPIQRLAGAIDFHGFRNIVHKKDTSKAITIGIHIKPADFTDFWTHCTFGQDQSRKMFESRGAVKNEEFGFMYSDIQSIGIEFTIAHFDGFRSFAATIRPNSE